MERAEAEELLQKYGQTRQRVLELEAALEHEQTQRAECAAKVDALEAAARQRDLALRDALEANDRIEFHNQRLTKRIAALQNQQQQQDASTGGGFFRSLVGGGGAAAEIAKLREELKITQQELEIKIVENVELSVRLSDQKEEFERLLDSCERRAEAARADVQRRDEEAAAALRIAREDAARACDAKDAALESLRSLQLELATARRDAVEREHALKVELQTTRSRLADASPFGCFCSAEEQQQQQQPGMLQLLRSLNTSVALVDPPVSCADARDLAQRAAELGGLLQVSEARAAELQLELASSKSAEPVVVAAPAPALQQQPQQLPTPLLQTPPTPPATLATDEDAGYSVTVEVTSGDERVREQQLQAHYEATIAHIVSKAHKADDRAQELLRECESLRASAASQDARERALEAELSSTKEDFESTRRAYETQMQAMSEHAAGLSEQVAHLDNELTALRGGSRVVSASSSSSSAHPHQHQKRR